MLSPSEIATASPCVIIVNVAVLAAIAIPNLFFDVVIVGFRRIISFRYGRPKSEYDFAALIVAAENITVNVSMTKSPTF